ncbi:MAG: hypothetical protein JNK73_01365 [Bacteroidia bacterium]|nr:hypothetical protein [Bacteroidia bacterium]
MPQDKQQRPHRVPPDQEEMARRLYVRERLRIKKILAFKSSRFFKLLNALNVCCFFICWELIFCFIGPCHYKELVPETSQIKYSAKTDARGFRYIKEINVIWKGEKSDKIIVEDVVPVHASQSLRIRVGRDFILFKNLKVKLGEGNKAYRLAHASPLLFLAAMLIVVTSIGYFFNLNQQINTLPGMTFFNLLFVLAIVLI